MPSERWVLALQLSSAALNRSQRQSEDISLVSNRNTESGHLMLTAM
jgi:hypothetical protein